MVSYRDHSRKSGEGGSNTVSRFKAGDYRFPTCMDREGVAPSFPACVGPACPLGPQPNVPVIPDGPKTIVADVGKESLPRSTTIVVAVVGIEPTIVTQGSRPGACDLRTRRQVRQAGFDRRRTAYETVLETRLQSTPQ